MKKYCTKCGHEFEAVGREVICPACKARAAEDARHAAVLRAKRASWSGESVPVRISGRASTVIREYGKAHNLPFAAALDDLLKASDYFKGIGVNWQDVEPYKSRRLKKSADIDAEQDVPQNVPQNVPQEVKQTVQAARKAVKTTSKSSKKEAKA